MSNNNQDQKESKQAQPIKQNGKSNKNSLVLGITFMLALAALLLSIYTTQHNQQVQNQLNEDSSALSFQIQKLKNMQTHAQEQLDAKADSFLQAQNTLQNKIETLNKQIQTSLSERQYRNEDWLLLKARYYIELAQINTHWGNDTSSAIALLAQADALLKQLNETKVFDIRQTIAKEIAELKTVSQLDIAGILSQLDAAKSSLNSLALQTAAGTDTQASNAPISSGWRSHVQNSVAVLEKLVVIRRDNEDIKPLLSPLYESIIKESIQLNLQEAQWAVINRNPVVFKLAIKQAIENIKRTFNTTNQNTTALLTQLNEMQQLSLNQDIPEIGQAIPLLNQIIETKELQTNPQQESKQGEKQS